MSLKKVIYASLAVGDPRSAITGRMNDSRLLTSLAMLMVLALQFTIAYGPTSMPCAAAQNFNRALRKRMKDTHWKYK